MPVGVPICRVEAHASGLYTVGPLAKAYMPHVEACESAMLTVLLSTRLRLLLKVEPIDRPAHGPAEARPKAESETREHEKLLCVHV